MRSGMRLAIVVILGPAAILIGCTAATPQPAPTQTQPPATDAPAVEPTAVLTEPPPPTATSTHTPEPPTHTPTATATQAPAETPTTAPTVAALPDASVTYQDFEIVPASTTIPRGARVVFLIRGAPGSFHQPYSFDAPNRFESPTNLGDGATYAYTFNEPGTVTIGCGYHANMVATVIITP